MMVKSSIDVPVLWEKAASRIVSNRYRKILVLGGTDRGKSTFCGYLSNMILESGREVAYVDADVGQKDIGPPATITLGYPGLLSGLDEISPFALYFVGSVSPEGHLLPMVVGTKRMVDASRAPFVVINTTGLIHQTGRVLKGYKIELIRPDVIVAIERSNELKSIIRQYRNHRIIRIEPSARAAPKDIDDRRKRREKAFATYFEKAAEVVLETDRLIFQRSLLFSGKRIDEGGAIYREITSEGVITVCEKSLMEHDHRRNLVAGFEKNLLCGLGNWKNYCIGLGIIIKIEFDSGRIRMITPVEKEKIKIIQPGDLYIEPSGKEIGRKSPGNL